MMVPDFGNVYITEPIVNAARRSVNSTKFVTVTIASTPTGSNVDIWTNGQKGVLSITPVTSDFYVDVADIHRLTALWANERPRNLRWYDCFRDLPKLHEGIARLSTTRVTRCSTILSRTQLRRQKRKQWLQSLQ